MTTDLLVAALPTPGHGHVALPRDAEFRAISDVATDDLAAAYHACYDHPGAESTLSDYRRDVARILAGEHGEVVEHASAAVSVSGCVVGGVIVVRGASRSARVAAEREDLPAVRVLELFVAPRFMRHGYGEALMRFALTGAAGSGASSISLRVERDAEAARRLYARLGFVGAQQRPGTPPR